MNAEFSVQTLHEYRNGRVGTDVALHYHTPLYELKEFDNH